MFSSQSKNGIKNKSTISIENIHNYENFKQYICRFSNDQQVNILIAITKAAPNCVGNFVKGDSTITIKHVTNLNDWIKQIAVRKKMNEMKNGEYIDSSLLCQFDGIMCVKDQKMIGINTGQMAISLSEWREKQENKYCKEDIRCHYKDIISDLHHHNIVFQQINRDHLAFSPKHKSFILRLKGQWDIYSQRLLEPRQLNSINQIKLKQQNIDQIKTVFQQIEQKCNENQPIAEEINNEVTSFLSHVYVMSTLYFKEFNEFKRAYEMKFEQKFRAEDNKELTQVLFKFYEATNQSVKLSQLLNLQSQQVISKLAIEWQSIMQLQRISLEQLNVNQAHSNYQNGMKSKISTIKLTNRKFNKNQQSKKMVQKNKVEEDIQFEKSLQTIKVGNKIEKIRWHFGQAKKSSGQFQFYRAIGHLKKCGKYQISESMLLSVIELELGRNYQHLCLVSQAQAHYHKCIQIREQLFGTQSQSLSVPLHNLLYLQMKSGNKQELQRIYQRIVYLHNIKVKTAKQDSNACQSAKITSFILNEAYNPENGSTLPQSNEIVTPLSKVSKQELIKWQSQRFPGLNQFYIKAKQIIQRPEVQRKHSPALKDMFKFGQLKILNSVLTLIQFLHQNKKLKLSDLQQQLIIATIEILQKTNIRLHHIFLFIMSYYWQKNNQYQKAINYIKRLLRHYIGFKQTLVSSVLKRLLQLYKRAECFCELISLYRSKQIDLEIYELYDCINLLFRKQQYALLIKYCNDYLTNIKQYPTIAEQEVKSSPLQNRMVDCSQSVSYILVEAYFNCRDYESAWKIINQLPNSFSKLNLQNFWRIIVAFCVYCSKQKQAIFCLEGFSKLMMSIDGNEQRYYSNEKMILLQKDLWVNMVDYLANYKISEISLYFNWLRTRGNLIIKDIDKSILVGLNEKLSQQCLNTRQWLQLKQLIKMPPQSINCEFNQIQQTMLNLKKYCAFNFNSGFTKNYTKLKTEILKNTAMDFDFLFKDIVDLIEKLVQLQGRSSPLIISLHLLLFYLAQQAKAQECQLLLLFGMVAGTTGLTISQQEEDNIISTVAGRQYRFDQLFYQYCMKNKKDIKSTTSKLSRLWWYKSHLSTIQSLQAKFGKIMRLNVSQDQQQSHQSLISSFKIKYFSYFTSQLQDSSLIAALTQKQSELQFQDQQI